MATINLENVAATASITIQLIKDYSLYESEIISSNGTIFQSTDTDTTLTLRVFKGVEEVTNKITDIEWSRYYFEGEELKEDFEWKLNKKDEKRIVLYKEEIEGKSIIQASSYSIIEGTRELVSTARLTVIKISDVYVSDVTPIDPSDKMMWMDTKVSPPVLKIWDDINKIWISSGTDIPIVKNFIRNSNFWTDITDYYTVSSRNINDPVISVYQNKNWITLQSKNAAGYGGGINQEIQYPIITNSSYIFSFIAYKEDSAYYNGNKIAIKILSKDNKGQETNLINTSEELSTSIKSISVPFTTLNDTEKITVYIGTQDGRRSMFYATELSLYNSSVYYPWEACPDDVNNQMNVKLDNNRLSVFNTLMDNGNYKAIYESNKQYYIRRDYITPEVATQEEVTELSNDFASFQASYSKDKTNINNSITNLQTNLTTLSNTHASDKTTINNNINKIQNELTTFKTNYATDKTNINKDIQSLKDKDIAFAKDLKSIQETHEADVTDLDGRINTINNSMNNSVNTINNNINTTNKNISNLVSIVEALQEKVKTLEDKIKELEKPGENPGESKQ